MLGEKLKIGLFLLVIGVGLFFGGCSFSSFEEEKSSDPLIKPRFGLDAVQWEVKKLGRKIQTTSVHPADSGFLTGETTTDLDGEKGWDPAPKLGLIGLIGGEDLRLKLGGDVRYNPAASANGYQEGFYDVRQQISDTRLATSGSFVFTQLTPDHLTYIPFVGAETRIAENIFLSFEVGFPYMEWKVRSGHDRWAHWETVQRDTWKGFGMRYAGSISFTTNGRGEFFISPFYEKYDPEFAGEEAEIEGWGVFFGLAYRF